MPPNHSRERSGGCGAISRPWKFQDRIAKQFDKLVEDLRRKLSEALRRKHDEIMRRKPIRSIATAQLKTLSRNYYKLIIRFV